jgi:hypothetical protein
MNTPPQPKEEEDRLKTKTTDHNPARHHLPPNVYVTTFQNV